MSGVSSAVTAAICELCTAGGLSVASCRSPRWGQSLRARFRHGRHMVLVCSQRLSHAEQQDARERAPARCSIRRCRARRPPRTAIGLANRIRGGIGPGSRSQGRARTAGRAAQVGLNGDDLEDFMDDRRVEPLAALHRHARTETTSWSSSAGQRPMSPVLRCCTSRRARPAVRP